MNGAGTSIFGLLNYYQRSKCSCGKLHRMLYLPSKIYRNGGCKSLPPVAAAGSQKLLSTCSSNATLRRRCGRLGHGVWLSFHHTESLSNQHSSRLAPGQIFHLTASLAMLSHGYAGSFGHRGINYCSKRNPPQHDRWPSMQSSQSRNGNKRKVEPKGLCLLIKTPSPLRYKRIILKRWYAIQTQPGGRIREKEAWLGSSPIRMVQSLIEGRFIRNTSPRLAWPRPSQSGMLFSTLEISTSTTYGFAQTLKCSSKQSHRNDDRLNSTGCSRISHRSPHPFLRVVLAS